MLREQKFISAKEVDKALKRGVEIVVVTRHPVGKKVSIRVVTVYRAHATLKNSDNL